ncbi:ribosomal protein S6 modification protein [Pasteurellaceae bacterium 15-036681]|nr:ribosomal protein S6 modification protein [Pasteurellaceae bacterium 15-036681]
MRLLMLCREPRLYSCQRLVQAAEQLGYQMDILDPNRFLLRLEQGQFQLYYHYGESYDKERVEPIEVGQYDAVLGRFGTSSTEMGCHVLRHFESKGVRVLNSADSFRLARDKWQSLQVLNAHNIPIPTTTLAGNLYGVGESLTQFELPVVVKTLSGSQGVGVMLAEGKDSATSLLETLKAANVATLQQQFIAESKGQDIRAFVIGNKVVATMQRSGVDGEFRANIHRGGSATTLTLTDEEQTMAVKATQALGLDIAGVDLIRSDNGVMVIEVNASPGLEMIEKISQVDIATQMIQFLLQK